MTETVQRISSLMEKTGTSGAFISRLIGKSRTTVSVWRAGKSSPTQKDLEIIAAHFGVTVEYLKGEEDLPQPVALTAPQRKLYEQVSDFSESELEKVSEYIQFVKSQRKPE